MSQSYMTLSYRWPETNTSSWQLTRSSLAAVIKSIALSSLPRTHRVAIAVTHKLGINYLSIDAMCKAQDEKGDEKQREVSVMGQIYKNGVCNITVGAGLRGDDASLFISRDP